MDDKKEGDNMGLTHNTFTLVADTWDEGERLIDELDNLQRVYGSGMNAFRVAICPGGDTAKAICPFDTVYLNDRGAEECGIFL